MLSLAAGGSGACQLVREGTPPLVTGLAVGAASAVGASPVVVALAGTAAHSTGELLTSEPETTTIIAEAGSQVSVGKDDMSIVEILLGGALVVVSGLILYLKQEIKRLHLDNEELWKRERRNNGTTN